MSTLTGNKISLTYKSLIKTADNDVLSGALKQLSDGLGNNSGVYLNTGGDLKSTGTLEFANFKGTSTAVTINKLVNEADGISNNDNDTSLPTSAAVKDYVDTHVTTQDLDFSDGTNPGAVDLDSQVFAIVGTSNEIETSASGQQLQIGLPDNVTISGTFFATEFQGALAGTINSGTTAVTQTAGDNSTKVATTAYVDTLDAASDLDFSGDSGTGDVNLNTESLAVTGTANQITTAASNQGLEISLLSTGVTMPDGSVATTQTAGDNSTKLATTAYVDTLDAASDLDITDGTNTSDINLNTESLSILGTANEIVSTVSAQTATISLPSTINVNVNGNVTGDLTGNADTATAWQTARDLSLTSEATGTISSVDGSGNVSGAVTLLNSAVTAKVLTGLPTPAAGNIEPSDTILEAFGKVQSQINSISSGLVFKGSWDAATNTPNLTSGGGEVDSGTTDGATTAFKLIDSSQNFNTTVSVGNKVINQVDGQTALVTVIDSNTQLTLDADIMLTAEAYTIDASPFISQGQYYVVNFAGTTNLNGINNWSIGDWVIADANNEWSKLDHSQIDGQGTTGNLPVFTTANTIGDSIVSESGTALTVTGSLTTTLGASVTGDFAVNTDKFTVNATSGNTVVGGTGTFAGNVNTGRLLVEQSGADMIDITRTGVGTYRFAISGSDAFSLFDVGANADRLIINSSGNSTFAGNVNVGTTGTKIVLTSVGDAYNTILRSWQLSAAVGNVTYPTYGFYGNTGTGMYSAATDTLAFTTGAVERMRIDSSGNTTFKGNVTLTSAAPLLYLNNTTASTGKNWRLSSATNGKFFITQEGVVDAVTIDHTTGNSTFAGSVGIGLTTSPSVKLDVVGSGKFQPEIADGDALVTIAQTNTNAYVHAGIKINAGNTNPFYIYQSGSSNTLRFNYNSLADAGGQLVITDSGKVGIGVDASDYWVNANNLVVGGLGAVSGITIATDGNLVGSLIFADGTLGGDNTRGGLQYDHSTNDMLFRVNNAERMRIHSNGRVTIGSDTTIAAANNLTLTNASSAEMDINCTGGHNYRLTSDTSDAFIITDKTVGTERMRIDSVGNVTITGYTDTISTYGSAYNQQVYDSVAGSFSQAVWKVGGVAKGLVGAGSAGMIINTAANATAPIIFMTGSGTTERMRIDSSGVLTVGGQTSTRLVTTLTENDKVDINSVDGTSTARNLTFSTGNTERIRILSNGRFQFSNISATQDAVIQTNETSTGTGVLRLQAGAFSAAYGGGIVMYANAHATKAGDVAIGLSATAGSEFRVNLAGQDTSTDALVCDRAGNLTITGTLYENSDITLKENIKPLESQLDIVSKLNPVSYNKKENKETLEPFTGKKEIGFIAQEVEEILPELVSENKEGIKSLAYVNMNAVLVKAIQELKAEVDKLKQECKCK